MLLSKKSTDYLLGIASHLRRRSCQSLGPAFAEFDDGYPTLFVRPSHAYFSKGVLCRPVMGGILFLLSVDRLMHLSKSVLLRDSW